MGLGRGSGAGAVPGGRGTVGKGGRVRGARGQGNARGKPLRRRPGRQYGEEGHGVRAMHRARSQVLEEGTEPVTRGPGHAARGHVNSSKLMEGSKGAIVPLRCRGAAMTQA